MATTRYAWDPEFDCIFKETDESGAITARYTQEPRPYGGLVSQRRGSTTSYYHYDNVGTTRALTNPAQTVTDRTTYTAFGEQVDSSGTTVNPFGFVGKLGYSNSSSTATICVRARQYQSAIGRWKSIDGLKSDRMLNHYRYCGNVATRRSDPSGLLDQAGIQSKYKPRLVPPNGWKILNGGIYFRENETMNTRASARRRQTLLNFEVDIFEHYPSVLLDPSEGHGNLGISQWDFAQGQRAL